MNWARLQGDQGRQETEGKYAGSEVEGTKKPREAGGKGVAQAWNPA